MGSMLSFGFHDPDGAWHEVVWGEAGRSIRGRPEATEWKMIDLD